MTRSARRRTLPLARTLRLLVVGLCAVFWLLPSVAHADEPDPEVREARLAWNAERTELSASFSYRDVVDAAIRRKLVRGLPTTIVLTGTLYDARTGDALSTTAQTCKITWHIWNEAYRLEITRPERSRMRWTPTLEGVLRRCAEANDLLVASSAQVAPSREVFMVASVQVNPVSQAVLTKIKHWVSRPLRTGTAAPGDALFSTFTGLFMRRIGEAERKLDFRTRPVVPSVPAPKPPKESKGEG